MHCFRQTFCQRRYYSSIKYFPVRNPGKFFCDIFLNEKQNILLQITTEDKKKIIFKKKLNNFKEGMIDIDLSKVKEGFYFVNVVSKDKTVTKKMKIKRDG
ncbi:MAG: T9SS type A sorting domain-containing protein [Ignavibacteria bacterium]|nr:T9SS type A sorting domain-containing protein [Ignavibacteria bacterium]